MSNNLIIDKYLEILTRARDATSEIHSKNLVSEATNLLWNHPNKINYSNNKNNNINNDYYQINVAGGPGHSISSSTTAFGAIGYGISGGGSFATAYTR